MRSSLMLTAGNFVVYSCSRRRNTTVAPRSLASKGAGTPPSSQLSPAPFSLSSARPLTSNSSGEGTLASGLSSCLPFQLSGSLTPITQENIVRNYFCTDVVDVLTYFKKDESHPSQQFWTTSAVDPSQHPSLHLALLLYGVSFKILR